MKKFYIMLCLVVASLTQLHAQAPQGFNYQASVRNSAGSLIVNANVYFKFNVIQGSPTAVPIFTETHYVSTDDLGQVNLVIGQGTANTGTFSALDWSLGSYYLGIELDTGNGYVTMGTTQLLSVPYALYAENSGNSTLTTPNLETVLAENNSANNQQIKDLQDPTEAQDAATKAYIDALIAEAVAGLQSQIDALNNNSSGSVTDQDGNTYDYLTYGVQQWTVENAEMVTYRDGTPIPQVTNLTDWQNLTTGAWCYYNNDPANNATYGKLYNWYAVAGIHDNDPNTPNKILAPDGWHVPSDTEWTILTDYLGGLDVAGGKMKATGTSLWQSPNTGATNESGFSALPAGQNFGGFVNQGFVGHWWSSSIDTTLGSTISHSRRISNNYPGIGLGGSSFDIGISVRLVKD